MLPGVLMLDVHMYLVPHLPGPMVRRIINHYLLFCYFFFYDYCVIRLHKICTGSILYGSFTPVEFDYIGVLKGVSSIAAYTSWPSKRIF